MGSPLRGGTVLTGPRPLRGSPLRGGVPYGRAELPYGSFTEKDDEEAYGKAGPEFREAYGKLWGETLPELGGNFRLCAVDQKRPFFLGLGRFWTFYPLRDLSPLQGPLRGPPYGKAPYGEASYGKARPLQEAPTRRDGPYGKGRGPVGKEGPLRGSPLRGGTVLTRRAGPLWKGRAPLRVLHREGRRRGLQEGRFLTGSPLALTGRPTYGKASYGEASYRKAPYGEASYGKAPLETPLITGKLTGKLGPYGKPLTRRDGPYGKGRSLQGPLRADRLTGRPLTGRLLTRRPLTNYRKAHGKLRGGTLPELGGNFRLCAVDPKKPFFPSAGPFLDLLPFKGPFSLTGALTGTALWEGPLRGGFLREGWALTGSPLRGGTVLTGRAGVPYGSFREGRRRGLREGPLRGGFLREGPLRITGKLTGSSGERFYQNWAGISACVP